MMHVKNSPFYKEAIQEINYPFGDFYLFENFVIGEIKADIVFTWADHGQKVVEELTDLYGENGKGLVYITNRVNSYSVVPSDWINFYKLSYQLKGYAVVSYSSKGLLNSFLEKIFMRNTWHSFEKLENAISWAKSLSEIKGTAA
ncbi:hypothetical protein GGR42_003089 [Saonia flava]|uniref:STAS/SEC14 domain-containing protein n=1 Tax=Saonia flava TaxID=523696 RepID=A0A846QXC2_9FLAO|nr:hypothetical protein [Saonia flava]NJB72598.1 hypothetical protein [Saonia flava]